MTLETVTKEEWDKHFKETIILAEKEILYYMGLYKQLLDLRSIYRQEYKTNRIVHQLDEENGVITYKIGTKRMMGFNYKNNKN